MTPTTRRSAAALRSRVPGRASTPEKKQLSHIKVLPLGGVPRVRPYILCLECSDAFGIFGVGKFLVTVEAVRAASACRRTISSISSSSSRTTFRQSTRPDIRLTGSSHVATLWPTLSPIAPCVHSRRLATRHPPEAHLRPVRLNGTPLSTSCCVSARQDGQEENARCSSAIPSAR